MTSTARPLAQTVPGTRALLVSSVLARLPLATLSVVLLVHAQQLSHSFAVAGAVGGAYALCGALCAPGLGRLVDRRGQTHPLLGCAALTAVLLIGTGLTPAGTSAVVLIVLAGGVGAATPPLAACVRTLLPALSVDPRHLPGLFAFESTVIELTFIVGPPLALGLATVWSSGGALIACGLAMLAGTAWFCRQPISRAWRSQGTTVRRSGSPRVAAIRTLVLIDLATGLVFGATEVGVTAGTKQLAATAMAGPVLGLWGVGSLLGGILATRRGGAAATARGLALLLAALAGLHGALALTTGSLPAMAVVITLAGVTIAPTGASIYALVDRAAPSGSATEAFSWLYSASTTGAAIGAASAGALVQMAGPAAAFGLAGLAGAIAVLVTLRAPWRSPQGSASLPRGRAGATAKRLQSGADALQAPT